MARHIKVRAELLYPDFQRVKITILEQTHFLGDFGNLHDGWNSSRFKYGKLTLKSNYLSPGSHGYTTIFNIAGGPVQLRNGYNTTVVTADMWPRIKKAIEAYNKRFLDEP